MGIMNHVEFYIVLLGIIVIVGILCRGINTPPPLILVIVGAFLSPAIPPVTFQPELVLNFFLPLLIYEASSYNTSWRDVRSNQRIIALLSIGHVLFITLVVAIVAHALIPGLTWPFAFILGAVISPPDDVAILAIGEKLKMPQRVLTILSAEGLLNDATALIMLRFAVVAAITHQFSLVNAVTTFCMIVVLETLYGLCVGYAIGQLRLRISDPLLQIMLSILTPFLAYLPAIHLGGSGVLATVVAGFVIGHFYVERFSPEVRILSHAIWHALGFLLQSILFLLVGLNFDTVLESIWSIPAAELALYGIVITLVVILGRFLYVYPCVYLPRFFSFSKENQTPYPPWQYPFITSWAGMRGGISLAAALAVPNLNYVVNGVNLHDLLIFLVLCVITATLLIQGLTFPYIMRFLGLGKMGSMERDQAKLSEMNARIEMTEDVLHMLEKQMEENKDNQNLADEILLAQNQYEALKRHLLEAVKHYDYQNHHPARAELECMLVTHAEIIETERTTIMRLWHEGKINMKVKTQLITEIDMHSRHIDI